MVTVDNIDPARKSQNEIKKRAYKKKALEKSRAFQGILRRKDYFTIK